MGHGVGNGAGRPVLALVGAVLVGVGLTAVVSPREVFTPYRQPLVVGLVVALTACAVLWRPGARVRRCCRSRWAAPAVTVLAAVVALVTGHALRLPYSWDVRIVLEIAGRLHAGTPLTDYQQGYLSRYPNNVPIVAVDRAAHAVSEAAGWPVDGILVTVAALGATVTVWCVHRMVLPVGGPVRAVGAQLVTVLLVAASPWLAIPYTDVLALPFVSGGLLLAMAAARRRHDGWALLLAAAAGAAIALAAVLKTIPYVVVAALLVTGVLAAVAARADRRAAVRWLAGTVAAVGAVAVVAVGSTAAARTALSEVPPRPSTSAPQLWWLANGMTETRSPDRPPRYGGFNGVMVRAIGGMSEDQAGEWAAEWIRALWASRGLDGTARFYANKAAWNWGDGMFWAWGEGKDARPEKLPPADGVVGLVRDVDRPNGRWYAVRSDITQAVWVTVLVVGGLGALLSRRPGPELLILSLSVLGLVVFTLAFQGRSRYLFPFVPVVVSLAAMVHPAVSLTRARVLRAIRRRTWQSARVSAPPTA